MFNSARLKLTAWYLLIIMLISLCFSAVIYGQVNAELDRGFAAMELQLQSGPISVEPPPVPEPVPPDPRLLAESLDAARRQVLFILLYANAATLIISTGAGYLLAGWTLKPIRQAMDEQKRFVADASHELRTPLTALKASIEVALRDKKLSRAQAKEVLESNLEDVDDLATLAERLLSLQHYQQKNGPPSREPIDVKDVVEEAVERVLPLAESRGVEVEQDVGEGILEADRAAIAELLVILLDNAVKYTPKGGRVTVEAAREGKYQILSVTDTGPGIKHSQIRHVFDRFYRGDASRGRTDARGYGLGLSLAKEIVDAHKGSIDASSTPGSGSTFTVRLPVGR